MLSTKNYKLRSISACVALGALALAVGCRGFFVKPNVTSVAIGPANLSIAPATTGQRVATATYDDGSTSDVTGRAVWFSSNTSVATFSSPGKLLAAALTDLPTLPAQTDVTASVGTVSSSSQTVNVCPVVQSLTLTVNGGASWSGPGGTTVVFKVDATFNGVTGTTDATSFVTWNISNTSVLPSIDTSGNGTTNLGVPNTLTNVTASLCGATSHVVTVTTTS